MNSDTGQIRRLTLGEALRLREVLIPEVIEEAVINMTRKQRRAWARREAKRLLREKRAEQP